MAAASHYSHAHLTNLVKQMTGQSIRQWIIERRISAARRLLATTDDDLSTVAHQLGFTDVSYFCRCFLRVTGSTPGDWRARRRPLRPFRSVRPTAFFWYATQIDYASEGYTLVQAFCEAAKEMSDVFAVAQAAVDTAYTALSPALAQFMWHDEEQRAWISGYRRNRRILPAIPEAGDTFGAYPTLIGGQTICAHRLEYEHNSYYRLLAKTGFQSLIATPILHREHCLGALIILESRQRLFSKHEQSLAHLLGRYVGVAMGAYS